MHGYDRDCWASSEHPEREAGLYELLRRALRGSTLRQLSMACTLLIGVDEHPCDHQTISKSPSHTDYTAPCHCPVTLLSKQIKISPPIVVKLAFSLRRHFFQRGLRVCRRAKYGPSFIGSSSLCCVSRQKCKIIGNEKNNYAIL